MKRLKIYIHILPIILLIKVTVNAQTRNVIWIHGLDGSEESWSHYEQLFSAERAINSMRQTYNTANGITPAANQVSDQVKAFYGITGATDSRNLAIAHSMGGLVARDIDRLKPNGSQFGGIISVTTPNYGAAIANSLLDGSVTSAAQNGFAKLTAGPLAQFLPINLAIAGLKIMVGSNYVFITPSYIANLYITNDKVQNLIGNPIVNADLREGSPTINALSAYSSSIPRISIWANESSPVHWRMFSSSQLGDDQTLVDIMETARGYYQTYYVANLTLGSALAVLGFWNPLSWVESAYLFYSSSEWKLGRDWLDNSEAIWCTLIKSTRLEQRVLAIPTYQCISYWFENEVKNDCQEFGWVTTYETCWVPVIYPSDGLLADYTQKLRDIPSGNIYQVDYANHIEVRNMSQCPFGDNTRKEFNKIWNRLPENDFFRTPLKLK